jgi:Rod binding domain-containing protein
MNVNKNVPMKLQPAPLTSGIEGRRRLEKAAVDFEAILIGQFFKVLHSTVGNGGLIKRSFQRSIYEEMLQDEFAKSFAKRGGFNVHKVLMKQLGSGSHGTTDSPEPGEAPPAGKSLETSRSRHAERSSPLNREYMKLINTDASGESTRIKIGGADSFRKLYKEQRQGEK